ncbi:MAG: BamA/TamA family outer membrane protein [Pseudomonadota bacterium]
MSDSRPLLRSMLLLTLLGACASDEGLNEPLFEAPETAVSYEAEIIGLPDEEMTELAETALATFQRQDDGAQSLAFLKRRAQSDVATVTKLLRSRGYYNGSTEVTVTSEPVEGDGGNEGDDADEKTDAMVLFEVTPGEPFTLTRHDMPVTARGGDPALDAAAFGSPVGTVAEAAPIVDAETRALADLRGQGYPYAEKGKRRAVADLEALELEVSTPFDAGPLSVFGDITFVGLEDVREDYLLTYLDWEAGQTFSREELRNFQDELLATDLFKTVTVLPPQKPPEGDAPVALPVTVTAEEREPRTVSAALRFNTDRGPSVLFGFEHRNLYGANETFNAEAEAGLEVQRLSFGYREPQYLRDGQDFVAGLTLSREKDDAFDALTASLTAGFTRRLSPFWTVGAGGLLEASLIDDIETGDTESFLGGIPLFAEYDGSDDLLNPTKGQRFRADITPFAGLFDSEFAGFGVFDAQGSTYYDVTDEGKWVLAARGRIGTILSEDLETVPQTRRLYAGGGGSVRGFEQRFVGPLDAVGDPVGGRSVLELGGEVRARFGDLGGVVFVDAGSVATDIYPSFEEGIQVAAGLGFRFFSPAGPIRVDVAFPVNGRAVDDTFQLFFSIGQAF